MERHPNTQAKLITGILLSLGAIALMLFAFMFSDTMDVTTALMGSITLLIISAIVVRGSRSKN